MYNEEWIQTELKQITKKNLYRQLFAYQHKNVSICDSTESYVNFSSNNYLNLAHNQEIITYATQYLKDGGIGSEASRLITGTLQCHVELEKSLARFKHFPASLIFGSGYLTNAGLISTLIGKDDQVFCDKLVHASIVDAIIVSKTSFSRFHHNDPDHLEKLLRTTSSSGKKLIVTESVFSMDGDLAPLVPIAELAEKYDAMLMVDEAHATGIFGSCGRGLISEYKLEEKINVAMGTFSKGLGSYGGFAVCSKDMKKLLINKARSFIYSTSLPPVVIGSAMGALKYIQKKPTLGKKLLQNAALFRKKLNDAGLHTGKSASQIIPIIIGEEVKTMALSQRLKKEGLLTVAIRPPTVPVGTSRLRLSVTLGQSISVLEQSADIIIKCAQKEGIL